MISPSASYPPLFGVSSSTHTDIAFNTWWNSLAVSSTLCSAAFQTGSVRRCTSLSALRDKSPAMNATVNPSTPPSKVLLGQISGSSRRRDRRGGGRGGEQYVFNCTMVGAASVGGIAGPGRGRTFLWRRRTADRMYAIVGVLEEIDCIRRQ